MLQVLFDYSILAKEHCVAANEWSHVGGRYVYPDDCKSEQELLAFVNPIFLQDFPNVTASPF